MERARVAVITRTKNRPLLLRRALESVAAQTMADYVHVIVNDGGEADSVEALVGELDEAARSRTLVIHNPESLGMEAASNVGIRASSSELLLIHDDDDSLHPQFLERAVAYIDAKGDLYAAVSTWIMRITESLTDTGVTFLSQQQYSTMQTVTIAQMAVNNRLVPISVLYRRSLHEEVGLYDESLPVLGDWEFFLRVLERHDIGVLPEVLANYHVRSSTDGDYANSIGGANDKHVEFNAVVKNRLLRRDIERGRLGIGMVAQIAGVVSDASVNTPDNSYVRGVVAQVQANRLAEVAIYGTGNIAAQLFNLLELSGIKVSCFIESDARRRSPLHLGLPVRSLAEAIAGGHRDIAVGSFEFKGVIVDRIAAEAADEVLRIFCA